MTVRPAPAADRVDLNDTATGPIHRVPLGGQTRDSRTPEASPPEGYEDVEDEGGEDAWSLTRNGRRDGV